MLLLENKQPGSGNTPLMIILLEVLFLMSPFHPKCVQFDLYSN